MSRFASLGAPHVFGVLVNSLLSGVLYRELAGMLWHERDSQLRKHEEKFAWWLLVLNLAFNVHDWINIYNVFVAHGGDVVYLLYNYHRDGASSFRSSPPADDTAITPVFITLITSTVQLFFCERAYRVGTILGVDTASRSRAQFQLLKNKAFLLVGIPFLAALVSGVLSAQHAATYTDATVKESFYHTRVRLSLTAQCTNIRTVHKHHVGLVVGPHRYRRYRCSRQSDSSPPRPPSRVQLWVSTEFTLLSALECSS